jgi:peptide deformylase
MLLTIGRPVDTEDFENGLATIVEQMLEAMYEAGGVGIAAPQVGISKRFFVMDTRDPDGDRQPQVWCELGARSTIDELSRERSCAIEVTEARGCGDARQVRHGRIAVDVDRPLEG